MSSPNQGLWQVIPPTYGYNPTYGYIPLYSPSHNTGAAVALDAPPVAPPPAPPRTSDPAKPGWTTTEFYSGVVAPFVFLILSQFNVFTIDSNNPKVEAVVKAASYLFAAIGTGFYAHSRGKAKAGVAVRQGLQVLASNLPQLSASATQLAPAVAHDLEPYVATLQAVDPQFSHSQLSDMGEMVDEVLRDHSAKTLVPMIESAFANAVKNLQTVHPGEPQQVAEVAADVQGAEDVIAEGAADASEPAPDGPSESQSQSQSPSQSSPAPESSQMTPEPTLDWLPATPGVDPASPDLTAAAPAATGPAHSAEATFTAAAPAPTSPSQEPSSESGLGSA